MWRGVRKVVVYSDSVVWEGDTNTYRSRRSPFAPSKELVQAKWNSFIEFISRVVNLREVVFDCRERVPIILLNALEEKHPACRLHVKNWTRLRSDVKVGDPYEEALARSPCLRSLEAQFLTSRTQLNHSAFERILALSPNLEAMSYLTFSPVGGMVDWLRPAPEAEVKREREKFVVASPVRKSGMRRIRYDSLNTGLIQRWERFFDSRKVESLNLKALDNTEWMDYARENGTFGGLKHLSFRITHHPQYSSQGLEEFKSGLADFLDSCTALESLSVVCYHGYIDLPAVLDRHGESLRSLRLHQVEGTNGTRSLLAWDDLDLIRSKAPRLESFELDVNRATDPGRNEWEIYGFISSFSNLRHLTIHYDLGVHHDAFRSYVSQSDIRYHRAYNKINEDFAREVWWAVRGEGLEAMVIYDGESNQEIGVGRPAPWVSAEQAERQSFQVTRNERDDLRNDVSAVKVIRNPSAG
ncbi:hypothetical protein V5O48_010884 [Marasmius crinis-equi]|uniref:Uncharacterized protein n=1 Tax=Marasmius crinis-equi TaxID=585013 RepID=A0ABR3F777_9AGAR